MFVGSFNPRPREAGDPATPTLSQVYAVSIRARVKRAIWAPGGVVDGTAVSIRARVKRATRRPGGTGAGGTVSIRARVKRAMRLDSVLNLVSRFQSAPA